MILAPLHGLTPGPVAVHMYLENQHTMEVILVQDPATKLEKIADQLITCKDVKTGKLQLTAIVIPPLLR